MRGDDDRVELHPARACGWPRRARYGPATAPAAAAENPNDPDWLARGRGLAALLTAAAMITIRHRAVTCPSAHPVGERGR
jgi:hypothetical protein